MQVKDVVAYAARRFITVVPEIELPGHCGAALACYPHLSCAGLSPDCRDPAHAACLTKHAVVLGTTICGFLLIWRCSESHKGSSAAQAAKKACSQESMDVSQQRELRHLHAGAKDMSQVPVQWGVHEDVFCAVSTVLMPLSCSCHTEASPCIKFWPLCSCQGCLQDVLKQSKQCHLSSTDWCQCWCRGMMGPLTSWRRS